MEAIVTSAEMREYERLLAESECITELELMDRAASGIFSFLQKYYGSKKILIVCGTGNNGGDGLAALHKLHRAGFDAAAAIVGENARLSPAAAHHLTLAEQEGCRIDKTPQTTILQQADVLVDCIFGIGLSREIEGRYANWINDVNAAEKTVISVDIPSGLDASTGHVLGCAIKADATVTFGFPKCGHFLQQGKAYTGMLHVVPLTEKNVPFEAAAYRLTRAKVDEILPRRSPISHKGDNGRALLCVGSAQYTGAALLASAAALRAGCGILESCVPGAVKAAFSQLPEVCCTAVNDGNDWEDGACSKAILRIAGKRAVGIGCGMGNGAIEPLLKAAINAGIPLVIDADGLNAIAMHPALRSTLHPNVILTPHPGEFSRLSGLTTAQILHDPIACAKKAARQWHCIVLLKGAVSCITDGERLVLNTTGNAGLAKGGSGDVLTGIITGLLSQSVTPFDAACVGAYLLGSAAETAFDILKERAMLARDVLAGLTQTLSQPLL